MANVPSLSNYTQTTVGAPTTPSTTSTFDLGIMAPLIREIVADGLVEEPKLQKDITSARSFFNGNGLFKADTILNDLKMGQQVRINILKDQNPLSLYKKSTLSYDAVDDCHDQIELDCTVPCINTLPSFQHIVFRFDTEYAYGVRACDKNKDFWDFSFFTKQYALSRQAEQFGRELDLWNTVMSGIIAAPATTVDVKLAGAHATHLWDNLGTVTSAARAAIAEAYWYMVTNFENVNPSIFMAAEAAQEIIKSVENPYNLNRGDTKVNTFEQWDVPGFMLADQVRIILGLPAGVNVLIMKRSPWLTTSATASGATGYSSKYPLWNSDATKQYVAILDPRVGYQVAKAGYSLTIQPYDCDKLIRGMIETEYVGSGLTFPELGMVLGFSMSTYA